MDLSDLIPTRPNRTSESVSADLILLSLDAAPRLSMRLCACTGSVGCVSQSHKISSISPRGGVLKRQIPLNGGSLEALQRILPLRLAFLASLLPGRLFSALAALTHPAYLRRSERPELKKASKSFHGSFLSYWVFTALPGSSRRGNFRCNATYL